MIKLFQKTETEKYIIIKILFIKITFKKKSTKSDIDAIVWWIPFKNLRNAIRNIYYEYKNNLNQANGRIDNLYSNMHRRFDDLYPFMWDRFWTLQNNFNEQKKELLISRNLNYQSHCNPSSLARDLKYLKEKGFTAKYAQPVDMFCHTSHIENVVLIEKD